MRERSPRRAAAYATPCAWFPADAAITPAARSASLSIAILLYAPRILNEKIGVRSSRFRKTETRRRAERFGAGSSAVGDGSTSDTRALSARFSMSLMRLAYRREPARGNHLPFSRRRSLITRRAHEAPGSPRRRSGSRLSLLRRRLRPEGRRPERRRADLRAEARRRRRRVHHQPLRRAPGRDRSEER